MKRVLILMSLVLFWSCEETVSKSGELIDFIPENTSIVFKISDFESLQTDIKNNGLLSDLFVGKEEFKSTIPYSFFSENSLFHLLHPLSESVLCINFSDTTEYTFITKQTKKLFEIDSLQNKSIETLAYKKYLLKNITIAEQEIFSVVKDSVFILSSSLQILQDIVAGKTEKNPSFLKIYNINNTAEFSAILNTRTIALNDSLTVNFATWAVLNTKILPDELTATGVILANDSVPQLLSIFKGLLPQQNNIAKVTPQDAIGVFSFTFNDIEIFLNNIQQFRNDKKTTIVDTEIFESVSEIGKIAFLEGNAIVLKSIDPSFTNEALSKYITQKDSYKEVALNEFNKPNLFTNLFAPLLNNVSPNYSFQLEDFFVFTENETNAQNIITAYLNNNCLSQASYFKDTMSQLSNASSMFILKMNGSFTKDLSNFFRNDLETGLNNISIKKYPLAALQFSYDRDFAHINLVCKETTYSKKSSGIVSQLLSINLDNNLLKNPQFFTNHRTGGKNIVAQDITNKLYFISSAGKTLWTKKLDGPIIGEINEVDILRNGKKQLAFTTKNTFYILDRNGRKVAPFPLNFKDNITQPISVFDYDKNRKYRFIITQGSEVFMYDSKGKTVTGFKFKKTKSNIVLPPQHIRMENKDYILIAEENGKLIILSRVGKSRVTVSKSFDFSEIPIVKEGNNFVVITKDNTKHSISQNGKVSSKKLNVSGYWFTIKGKTKVTLDDNLMRINGKLVDLPFGIYTPPTIFTVNRSTYISITETQENKVYIFNKSGEILPGFPVFGTSSADMADANKNGKINVLVQGDGKEILLFEL